jgi:hypothetical protein
LEADYQAGRPPQRFDVTTMPNGVVVERATYGPLSAEVQLTSPEPFQARYLSYAFPGWQVKVNGQVTPITPGDQEGLVTFPVPAGASVIEVGWGLTPLRRVLGAVSLLALFAIVATAFVLIRRRAGERQGGETEVRRGRTAGGVVVVLAVAVGFLLLKVTVLDRVETPLRRAALPAPTYPAALIGAELKVAGYDLSQESVAAGDTFDVDLAWLVENPPAADYQSNIWLAGPEGLIWSDKETERPRIYEETGPTGSWPPGQWAWDSREVAVLAGTPPGQYDIVLTLFDLADLSPLTLNDAAGVVVGPTAVLGQIEVRSPDGPVELSPQYPVDREVSGLTLLGYSQDRREAIPGEQMALTLFWQRPEEPSQPAATMLELALRDEDGRTVQSWELPPVRADYPPQAWPPAQGQRGQHSLRLAAGLLTGDYTFELEDLPLGSLAVEAPERIFDEPAYQVPVGADFAGQAELAGYTVEGDGPGSEAITLSLVWRGLAEMPVSYRVFIHLVDAEGQIVAQSDAEPAGWRRPTTGWAAGEYVLDRHTIQLPEGLLLDEVSLRIGLYEAQSGDRLATGGGDAFQSSLAGP